MLPAYHRAADESGAGMEAGSAIRITLLCPAERICDGGVRFSSGSRPALRGGRWPDPPRTLESLFYLY